MTRCNSRAASAAPDYGSPVAGRLLLVDPAERHCAAASKLVPELVELLLREKLELHELIARASMSANELAQLEMQRLRVPVLLF